EPTARARPFLACPHAEVWPVLNVWAESVEYGFGCLDISFVVALQLLLRFLVTGDCCMRNVGTVLVSLRNHAESLSQCVKRITFEIQLAAGHAKGIDGLPGAGRCPTVLHEARPCVLLVKADRIVTHGDVCT